MSNENKDRKTGGIRDGFDPFSDYASTPQERDLAIREYKKTCGKKMPPHIEEYTMSASTELYFHDDTLVPSPVKE